MCVLRNAAFRLEGKVCLSCKFFVSCLRESGFGDSRRSGGGGVQLFSILGFLNWDVRLVVE